MIKLLTTDASKSLLNNLDSSSIIGNSKFGTSKALQQVHSDKKLEDIYQELLEQSLNDGYQETMV